VLFVQVLAESHLSGLEAGPAPRPLILDPL
jgi:hypothetical protein